MTLAARIRGTVVPAVPVPFLANGSIDDEAQRQYARWMARQSVGGIAVWAHTGRGLWLRDEEREQVLSCWREALDETPIVCGVGVPHQSALPSDPRARTDRMIEHSVTMADAAKRGGASAVLVHPPTELRGTGDLMQRVVALHVAVAEVGLPVIAFYLYEAAGGISYASDAVERLLEVRGVVGIKLATLDSVMTFQDVSTVVQRHGNALLVTGEDRFLGYSLMLGAETALIGMAAACTDQCAALLECWGSGDLAAFIRISRALDAFAGATFVEPMEGYVQRMLWALEADGVIDHGTCDPSGPPLCDGERERVVRAVHVLRAS